MNGTLALWYERPDGSPGIDELLGPRRKPAVRLHVNLWRDLDKAFNFLDVGFLLTQTEELGRLYLYLPATLQPRSIFNLSDALKDADTLNAVFNEVAEIKGSADEYFTVKTENASRIIHHVNVRSHIETTIVNVPGGPQGTEIVLKSSLCDRIRLHPSGSEEHYVRLRIFLRGGAKNLFTSDSTAPGVGLSLAQDLIETTEFRLNERRSFPPSLLSRATSGRVLLKSVHYFLIRSRDFQISNQHTDFRKVRNLEHDIWKNYLAVGQSAKSRKERAKLAEDMIIYQWRALARDSQGLDDFIAYASFRAARPKILAYIIAVLAIGGVGSALNNVAVAGMGHVSWLSQGEGYKNLFSGLLLGAIALTPMGIAKLVAWWRQ